MVTGRAMMLMKAARKNMVLKNYTVDSLQSGAHAVLMCPCVAPGRFQYSAKVPDGGSSSCRGPEELRELQCVQSAFGGDAALPACCDTLFKCDVFFFSYGPPPPKLHIQCLSV